jgi:predicted RNase H-like HicB family nuclease
MIYLSAANADGIAFLLPLQPQRLCLYLLQEVVGIKNKLKMVYWKNEKFWVGKLLDHPEIMTQGETLEELEENLKDAYILMTLEDVPDKYKIKEIALTV